jgi:hypothetical protein
MLASVELKKRENRDDIDFFLQMKGYLPCGIYFFYQKQVPVPKSIRPYYKFMGIFIAEKPV